MLNEDGVEGTYDADMLNSLTETFKTGSSPKLFFSRRIDPSPIVLNQLN